MGVPDVWSFVLGRGSAGPDKVVGVSTNGNTKTFQFDQSYWWNWRWKEDPESYVGLELTHFSGSLVREQLPNGRLRPVLHLKCIVGSRVVFYSHRIDVVLMDAAHKEIRTVTLTNAVPTGCSAPNEVPFESRTILEDDVYDGVFNIRLKMTNFDAQACK